jgi:glutamate formiminotransferase / formiminotetrahydrofolate cyclodeaminase
LLPTALGIYNGHAVFVIIQRPTHMPQIVECIPNFSEARRPEVVDRIAEAISAVNGVQLLDRSSDLDHNRTVLTFAGAPEAAEEAAFRAIQAAAQLIDLNQHKGEHPRIGATDVVPFVPISDITMEECVLMARRVGERVGTELQIPVYFYEAAATRPDRTNLEDLRRGQYEGLKSEIESNPDRRPDFGPAKLGTAGATVIGARHPLIAFNVYLTTPDVDVAKKIAKAIRQSSGGFRFVKALGLFVDGRAQVSINLTNYRESPVGRVVELIRREAARYGTSVHHTEVVGLIPQAALVDAAVWYTQLDQFSTNQVLETRLYEAGVAGTGGERSPVAQGSGFLADLAAPTAAPGGGSAGAYAGAIGAALAEMVAGLTLGKNKYRDVEAEMLAVRARAQQLRLELQSAVEDDAAAFEAVLGAFRLPKETDAEKESRRAAIQRATLNAAHVPLHTATSSLHVMELAAKCARDGNLNAVSDAMSGAILAHAALRAAGYNVRINLLTLEDKATAAKMLAELADLEQQADLVEQEIHKAVYERAQLA